MRPPTLIALHGIDEAIVKLMTARLDLREAGCPAAVREIMGVIKSAENARRHTERCHKSQAAPTINGSGLRISPALPLASADWSLLRSVIASQEGEGALDDPGGAVLAKSALEKIQGITALDGAVRVQL